jgi:hypothetical protein
MLISPSKSRDLADENNKILTEWKNKNIAKQTNKQNKNIAKQTNKQNKTITKQTKTKQCSEQT